MGPDGIEYQDGFGAAADSDRCAQFFLSCRSCSSCLHPGAVPSEAVTQCSTTDVHLTASAMVVFVQ